MIEELYRIAHWLNEARDEIESAKGYLNALQSDAEAMKFKIMDHTAEIQKLRAENEALRAKLPRWMLSTEARLKLRDGQLVAISVPGHGCYAATYRDWSGDLPCHYAENDDIDTIAAPDEAGHWVYVIPTPPDKEPAP